ncbi:hypothetical protein EIP91_004869 [Steccherinum ochraceum]|uniref:Uncharacterized protein n=1 Tax=Steccherinum ochraceum TaxID=92696 RepID=A0A4R0RE70_9APHY|nr:hypothetical protein EIP91_004869 [Steccherinum ochraceum]
MSYNFKPSIFFLGATGYLGSEFLIRLQRDFPGLQINALVRSPTPERKAQLDAIYHGTHIVPGTLEDSQIILEESSKVDIVINCASSDHKPSVFAVLDGMNQSAARRPGNPPLLIHLSGAGIIADEARGAFKDNIPEHSDIGLDLRNCPPQNTHLDSDIPIVDAGTRKDNPIRSIIIFPSGCYGVGNGVQKTSIWLRFFLEFVKKLNYVGTWGEGYNAINDVHIKDCADALMVIFKAALEGRADEGAEGLYFCASSSRVPYREWTKVMGDYLYGYGHISQPGTCPMPNDVVDSMGFYGWSLLGGNHFCNSDRLAKLGWEPTESKKHGLIETLPECLDEAWSFLSAQHFQAGAGRLLYFLYFTTLTIFTTSDSMHFLTIFAGALVTVAVTSVTARPSLHSSGFTARDEYSDLSLRSLQNEARDDYHALVVRDVLEAIYARDQGPHLEARARFAGPRGGRFAHHQKDGPDAVPPPGPSMPQNPTRPTQLDK